MTARIASRAFLARSFFFLTLSGLTVAACDCGGSDPVAPCASANPPASCGNACTGDPQCTGGTYCGTDGTCTADCAPGDGNCGAGEVCDPTDGRCIDAPDGGVGGGTGGGTGTGGGAGGGGACQELAVTADPLEPYIIFVLDRSWSMDSDYPYASSGNGSDCGSASPNCLSRWDSLEAVLLGSSTGPVPLQGAGVIAPFAPFAHIGAVQYTGAMSNGSPVGAWPDLIETPAALNSSITMTYPYNGGRTPTGEALWMTLCHLDAPYDAASSPGCASYYANTNAGTPTADPATPLLPPTRDPNAPVIFILATDGAPNSSLSGDINFCDTSGTPDFVRTARKWVLDAVKEARLDENILTYVISLANDPDMNLHLEQVACEGGTGPAVSFTDPCPGSGETEPTCSYAGNAAGPGLIEAYDTDALDTALTSILAGSIPCSFTLTTPIDPTTITEARASATVTIDAAPISQATGPDTGSGWWLSDDGTTFSLVGQACTDFRNAPGANLEATFPCDSGVIIIPL